MLQFLPVDLQFATIKIVPYFTDSFGNSSQIDFSIGHETNFAAWLYCLARLGVIKEEDYHAMCEKPHPRPIFYRMLGQTHVNGWSRVIASQNGGSTSYIFPSRLRVL